MQMDHYQEQAMKTAFYQLNSPPGFPWLYPALGLQGEVGELSQLMAKLVRDKRTPDAINNIRERVKAEAGDVLWELAALLHEFDLSLEEVAQYNLDKLASRLERGKLSGGGDNR